MRHPLPFIPLNDGTFCVLAFIKHYGDEQSVISRKATYRDIFDWVKETYGVSVRHVDISRAKRRCGLAYADPDRKAVPGYRPAKRRPEREDMIIEAFRHFGMI